jgi:Nickel responsive protein SCO4226-like
LVTGIQELIDLPKDELGVTHINIFYNREADLCYCLLEAPSKEAVEKHHSKINVKCDWINEVTMAKK